MKKDLAERKDALREKMEALIERDEASIKVKAHLYIRELKINYDQDKFVFLPGDFMLDKKTDNLSICLGLSPSPNIESHYALWFLIENSLEIRFVDAQHIKNYFS